jgi:hypothetical protein
MISLNINGRNYTVQAPDDMPLLWVLRDLLNLKTRQPHQRWYPKIPAGVHAGVCELGRDHPVRRSSHLTPCSNPVLSIEKPDTGERPGLTGVAQMLRRLLFASSIVLGLAFAAVCYAEMFGFD